jgi:hypothetical protein
VQLGSKRASCKKKFLNSKLSFRHFYNCSEEDISQKIRGKSLFAFVPSENMFCSEASSSSLL